MKTPTLIAICACLSVCATGAFAENLLTNGSFEIESTNAAWAANWSGTMPGSMMRTNSAAYAGSWSMACKGGIDDFANVLQVCPQDLVGQRVRATCWMMSPSNDSAVAKHPDWFANNSAILKFESSSGVLIQEVFGIKDVSAGGARDIWICLTNEIASFPAGMANFKVVLLGSTTNGLIYYDDVQLEVFSGPSPSNQVGVTVTNVTAHQQMDSALVNISYALLNPGGDMHTVTIGVSTNAGATYSWSGTNFSGDVGAGVSTGTAKQVVWFSAGDLPGTITTHARVQVMATVGTNNYCIIDVAGGPNATNYPVSYQATAPPQNDVYKKTKIVLRKMPSGSFVMGSPSNELGRFDDETQHKVSLTKAFYMGIYEITQAQYSNVMGSNPSYFKQGVNAPKRPVQDVAWSTVRGGTWPGGEPTSTNFMGKLRAKTGALAFDLPTESQWEYACRASTTKALNNNTNLQNTQQDPNVNIVGRYWWNGGNNYAADPVNGGTAACGAYLVNQWGLYDMHGNVYEWCLDWFNASYTGTVDPPGPASGTDRVIRGGSWNAQGESARYCRSAARLYRANEADNGVGFRLVLPAAQ